MLSVAPNSPVILCIDDGELSLNGRREALGRQGYRVLSAHNGVAALQMFGAIHIDLVISDNRLPDLAGIDILKEMKRLQPRVPIIMLSGLPAAPRNGNVADLFINKSASSEAFLAAVALLLGPTNSH